VIRFSALLVAAAIALLVTGVIASSLPLVYVSIGVCTIAGFLLAIGVFRHRQEIFGVEGAVVRLGPPDAVPVPHRPSLAGGSAPAGRAAGSATSDSPTGSAPGPARGTAPRGAPGGRPSGREPAGGAPPGKGGPRGPGSPRPTTAPKRGADDPFWQRVSDEFGSIGMRDPGAAAQPRAEDPKRPEPTSPEVNQGSGSGPRLPASGDAGSGSRSPAGAGSGTRPGPRSAEPPWPGAAAWRPPADETFRKPAPSPPSSSPPTSSPPPPGPASDSAAPWPAAAAWPAAAGWRSDTREPATGQERAGDSPGARPGNGEPSGPDTAAAPAAPDLFTRSAAVGGQHGPRAAEPDVPVGKDDAPTGASRAEDASHATAGNGGEDAADEDSLTGHAADQPTPEHAGPDTAADAGRVELADSSADASSAGPEPAQDAGPAGRAGTAADAGPAGRSDSAADVGQAGRSDSADDPGSGGSDWSGVTGQADDDAEPAVTDSPGGDRGAAESGEPAGAEAASASVDVTVVPGVARYHRSECILIRFLGPDDLEIMTRQAAEAVSCVPCRACQPDKLPADA
jgi:hypothetical protein